MSALSSPTGLNLATALMVMTHTAQPDPARDALIEQRNWLNHWLADVNGNVMPTPESLSEALENINAALVLQAALGSETRK